MPEQVRILRNRINSATRGALRDVDSVTLVAISKAQLANSVRALAAAGVRDFGESYVQEALEKIDTLVVDKTGTLTEGKPRLVGVTVIGGIDENELLRLAASLERASEHPLAAAIVRGAEERGLRLGGAVDFTRIRGSKSAVRRRACGCALPR